jgi:hypothetical protein
LIVYITILVGCDVKLFYSICDQILDVVSL